MHISVNLHGCSWDEWDRIAGLSGVSGGVRWKEYVVDGHSVTFFTPYGSRADDGR